MLIHPVRSNYAFVIRLKKNKFDAGRLMYFSRTFCQSCLYTFEKIYRTVIYYKIVYHLSLNYTGNFFLHFFHSQTNFGCYSRSKYFYPKLPELLPVVKHINEQPNNLSRGDVNIVPVTSHLPVVV